MMSTQHEKSSIQRLITLERAQKLDLLIHLISNLNQSLIICGPEGIGKTTLLDALTEFKKESWPICRLQATPTLSFESIQNKIHSILTQCVPEYSGLDLSTILDKGNKQNSKIVVLIDDAGLLVPGLISALIEFAHANSCLRLVFALTHDELHIKSSTDRFIDECHLIEIPPVSKKQYLAFLQNLSVQPGASISFNAVTEGLVDNLYQHTQGIPGKILSELPNLSRYKTSNGLKWGVGGGLVVAALTAVVLNFSKPESQAFKPRMNEPMVNKTVTTVNISSPVVHSSGSMLQNKPPPKAADQHVKKFEPRRDENIVLPDKDKEVEITVTEILKTEIKPEVTIIPPVPEPVKIVRVETEQKTSDQTQKKSRKETIHTVKPSKPTLGAASWIESQNPNYFTMQLMVLSNRTSVNEMIRKYKNLKGGIKFFKVRKQGQDRFVLVYGAYETSDQAVRAKKILPVEFRKAWIRKFKVLQQQRLKN